jgi:hypothetical protein
MAYPEKKEINLFGNKSIREEAYRKKILQLEKEISRIESLAKGQDENLHIATEIHPKNLNNLYHESLLSFDARLKKEQELFEKRATEITERLDIKVQKSIIDIENIYRKKIRKSFLLGLFFVGVLALMLFSSNPGIISYSLRPGISNNIKERGAYALAALSTQTKYHHQYEVDSISVVDNSYIVKINLNNMPANTWQLRDMVQETTRAFNRLSGYVPAEISFSYDERIYAKARLEGPSRNPYIRYFY